MMSLTGKQIITRHVLLNISKSKDNQITWEIFFLKTRGQNLVQKLVPDLNQNSAYLFINSLKCYTVCFYCMAKLRSTKRYWHYCTEHCFYSIQIFFWKTNTGPKLVSLPHFLHNIWRKVFVTLYPINCPNLILWLRLALEILSKMCIVITCFPVFDAIKFENILCFITSHFLHQLLKG